MHTHREYTDGCFACKIKTLQFGRVPGGARSGNFFFEDELRSQFGNLEENAEKLNEATEGYGALRWQNGVPYYKDKTTGSYTKMSDEDLNRVMYGNKRGDPDESRVTVSGGIELRRDSTEDRSSPKHSDEVEGRPRVSDTGSAV